MIGNLGGWHLLIILAVVILIFGASKLPALAKSIGQSARIFKGEVRAMKEDDTKGGGSSPAVAEHVVQSEPPARL